MEELTEKEERVMGLLLHGASITEIAKTLNLSKDETKDFRTHLYNKLGVVNKVQAVLLYIKLKNCSGKQV